MELDTLTINHKLSTINYKILSALPKVWLVNWALVSRCTGNDCPSLVLQ